jgi:hypothetical protein
MMKEINVKKETVYLNIRNLLSLMTGLHVLLNK